jgi:adenosine deaminase
MRVELHRHLEGSVRYETYRAVATEAGVRPAPRRALTVSRGDRRTLASFLSKFAPLRGLYPSRAAIERVAREAVEDARADGVRYLELRFSPVHFARRMGFDAVETAGWIIAAARKAARGMTVNFLVTLGRDFDARVNAPSLDAAIAHRPAVVGLDVAGDEACPLDHLGPLLRRGRRAGLRLTVHAGEGGPARNVEVAVRRWGAERIGHGVRFRGRLPGVAFELCPTSNLHTGAWREPRTHPLRRMFDDGVAVSLNTDDPAISGIDLSHEYAFARRMLRFTADELIELNRRAMASAFR